LGNGGVRATSCRRYVRGALVTAFEHARERRCAAAFEWPAAHALRHGQRLGMTRGDKSSQWAAATQCRRLPVAGANEKDRALLVRSEEGTRE